MRIVEIRERTAPIASPIANAFIDFSKMTLSLVAVITDVVRDGRPVVGYGFNSNGRSGQGSLMRERFIPRVLEADLRVTRSGHPRRGRPRLDHDRVRTRRRPRGLARPRAKGRHHHRRPPRGRPRACGD